MTIQKTPNSWSCLLTAFAIALDEPYQKLIDELGHNGSELLWPELSDPYARRSFHPQEMFDLCLKRNRLMLYIERQPFSTPAHSNNPKPIMNNNDKRFNAYLQTWSGVLVGSSHAVAWDGTTLYDPKGYIIPRFEARLFLAIL